MSKTAQQHIESFFRDGKHRELLTASDAPWRAWAAKAISKHLSHLRGEDDLAAAQGIWERLEQLRK